MYTDKMLEYLVLADIMRREMLNREVMFLHEGCEEYNYEGMVMRINELKREFLEPYAIKSGSKE